MHCKIHQDTCSLTNFWASSSPIAVPYWIEEAPVLIYIVHMKSTPIKKVKAHKKKVQLISKEKAHNECFRQIFSTIIRMRVSRGTLLKPESLKDWRTHAFSFSLISPPCNSRCSFFTLSTSKFSNRLLYSFLTIQILIMYNVWASKDWGSKSSGKPNKSPNYRLYRRFCWVSVSLGCLGMAQSLTDANLFQGVVF